MIVICRLQWEIPHRHFSDRNIALHLKENEDSTILFSKADKHGKNISNGDYTLIDQTFFTSYEAEETQQYTDHREVATNLDSTKSFLLLVHSKVNPFCFSQCSFMCM